MQVGLLATLLAMLIAVPLGLVAGYYGGWLDSVIARTTDVMLAFPFVILAILLAAIIGPSLTTATIALGIAGVPANAPDHARRDARAPRGGVRARGGRERRRRRHDHLPAHPPEHVARR